MTTNQLNEHINKKYPHIQYKEGEDLNLNKIYINVISKVWNDKDNYPTMLDISKKVGLSERHIYRIAQKQGLGMRTYKPRI